MSSQDVCLTTAELNAHKLAQQNHQLRDLAFRDFTRIAVLSNLACCVLPLAGKWTVQQAAELSVPSPTIEAALDGRFLSGLKDQRVKAAAFYEKYGVHAPKAPSVRKHSRALPLMLTGFSSRCPFRYLHVHCLNAVCILCHAHLVV